MTAMMKTSLLLFAFVTLLSTASQAFQMGYYSRRSQSQPCSSAAAVMRPLLLVTLSPAAHHTTTRLLMSADIREDGGGGGAIGATERLLLAAKRQRELGLRQEYGTTVKKDGLDGVRAAVWALFGVSQVVFTVLGVALTLGLALNMLGYGYYFENGNFVVDGIDHIRQQQLFQVEANNLAVYEAVEQATTSGLPQ